MLTSHRRQRRRTVPVAAAAAAFAVITLESRAGAAADRNGWTDAGEQFAR